MGDSMNAATSYAVMSIFFSLCIITAGLRFYTRLCILRKFSADDYMLLIGIIILIPYTGVYGRLIYHLFYRPYSEYTLQILSNFQKYSFIMMPLYLTASIFVKLSIALRVLKFTREAPILRWIVIVVITLYTADVIAMIAINFTRCLLHIFPWGRPFKVGWGPHCIQPSGFSTANWIFSSMTCLTDFTLAIVPWFIVQKLWMVERRTKIILSVLLGLGSIASLATIARMFYTQKFASYPEPTVAGDFFLWLYLELTLATIACCVATLKPLVVKSARTPTTLVSTEPYTTTATSSTWSAHLKRYFVGDSGGEDSLNQSGTRTSTAFSFRHNWRPSLPSASTPRVLRHPSSVESLRAVDTRLTTLQTTRQPGNREMTQFDITFTSSRSFDESDSDTDHFGALDDVINYALQDEEMGVPHDVASSPQPSK